MKLKRLALIAVVVLALGGCTKDTELRRWARDALYEDWFLDVGNAICQLEEANPNGLDPTKRMCPGGPGNTSRPAPPPEI